VPGITGIGGIGPALAPNDVAAIPGGGEFSVGGVDTSLGGGTGDVGGSFGAYLVDKVSALEGLQQNASTQSQALATGQAEDVSAVVMQVEQAALAMQLAVQVRNKAVEAYQEILHLQI
jgi:flagellar hook-basal body complex protein FliE